MEGDGGQIGIGHALKDVVGAAAAVPELLAADSVRQGKDESLAGLQHVGQQVEGEAIGESVARVGHVASADVRVTLPLVGGEAHHDRLAEVHVDHAHHSANGHLLEHGGRLQTDVLLFHQFQEAGHRRRLRETGDQRTRAAANFPAPQEQVVVAVAAAAALGVVQMVEG